MLQPYVVSSYQHDCKEEGKNEGACTKQFIITPMMWRRTMVRGGKRLLLLQLLLDSWHGTQLSYTDTFKYLGMVCDKNTNLTTAALKSFTAGTFRVNKFVQENVLTNTGCMLAFGSSKPMQFLLACSYAPIGEPDPVNSFLKTGQRYGQPSSEVAFESVKMNPWGQGHYSFLVRYARVWP
jgi:hypothetical protein